MLLKLLKYWKRQKYHANHYDKADDTESNLYFFSCFVSKKKHGRFNVKITL